MVIAAAVAYHRREIELLEEESRRKLFAALAAVGGIVDLLTGNIGSLPGRAQTLRNERFLGAGNAAGLSRVDWYFLPLVQRAHLEEFRRQFRVSPSTFEFLERRLRAKLEPDAHSFRLDTLTLRDKIAIPLSVLGTRQDSAGVAVNTFGLGVSTVTNLLDQFTCAINHSLRDEFIALPDSVEEFSRIATAIEQERGIPGCFGAKDGKHFMASGGADNKNAFMCPKVIIAFKLCLTLCRTHSLASNHHVAWCVFFDRRLTLAR